MLLRRTFERSGQIPVHWKTRPGRFTASIHIFCMVLKFRSMYTLFPPPEFEDVESGAQDDARLGTDKVEGALSEDLRIKFDEMCHLARERRRAEEEEEEERNSLAIGFAEDPPPICGEKRKSTTNVSGGSKIAHRQFDMAVRTAIAVEDEISRLSAGISELESLLAIQENSVADDLMFPSLSPVIPSDTREQYDGTHDSGFPVPVSHTKTNSRKKNNSLGLRVN